MHVQQMAVSLRPDSEDASTLTLAARLELQIAVYLFSSLPA